MKLLLLLLCLVGFCYGLSLVTLAEDEWTLFKIQYGKTYTSEVEERYRRKIFLENKHFIVKHNLRADEHGYELGVNKFADFLPTEFNAFANGYRSELKNSTKQDRYAASFIEPLNIAVPDSFDWREKGAVTPIKDQGQCGSCWAFSTTGSLEGQLFRKTGKLTSISEQNLVDCTENLKYGNVGCRGGLMDISFQYIKDNDGIDTEESYPYVAKDGKCEYNPASKGGDDKGYVDIPKDNETALQVAVASIGPISVAIDASQPSFQFYKAGVYYELECDPKNIDHAVLVIGYGTENGKDYWLVKNSWSTTWGDQGFIKMTRNKDNNCGIASMASYPIV